MVQVNWPRFDRTPGRARRAWGYPQARARVGRLSTDRELITGTARRRRRTTEEKLQIIEASYQPGEAVSSVAKRQESAEPSLPLAARSPRFYTDYRHEQHLRSLAPARRGR
jgi:Transposase